VKNIICVLFLENEKLTEVITSINSIILFMIRIKIGFVEKDIIDINGKYPSAYVSYLYYWYKILIEYDKGGCKY